MAGSDKTVKVTLVAVATPYAKGMNDASVATRKLGTELDGVKTKTKGLEAGAGRASGALKGLAIGAGAVAATGLVSFLTDTVKAAGDLQQSVGGVDAVFKDSAQSIHDFGKNSAEAVGLSTNEFNQLVTVTGAMLKNKGLADFTDQSLTLVKVGADLAAQFGGPTSQAVEALNAALRGESDPIERYGIALNETAVNAELASRGIQKINGNYTEQQKTVARLAIIQRQSADAMGAFARESNTLQGQQQRLNAEWANAKAELGTALLPALTDVTQALRQGVDVAVAAGHAWEQIPGPVKAAIAALVIYKLTNDKISTGVLAARDSIKRMREELALQQALAGGIAGGYQRLGDEAGTAGQKVSRAAGAIGLASKAARGAGSALLGAFGGPVGIAITGLTVAIGVFAAKHAEAKARVEDFTAAIKADSGAMAENTREAAANALEKSGALKAAKALGVDLRDLVDASVGQVEAQERVNAALERASLAAATATGSYGEFAAAGNAYTTNAAKVRDAIGGTNDELNQATAEYRRHVEAVGNDSTEQQKYGAVVATTTGKVEDQAKAVRDAAQAVLDSIDAKKSAYDAEIAYQGALDDTSAAIKENGKNVLKNGKVVKDNGDALNLNTKAGRDNAQALSDLAQRIRDKSQADIEAGASLKGVRDGMAAAKEEFIKNAEKAGLSADAAEKMANKFGLTKGTVDELAKSVEDLPASKQIKIEAETKAAAEHLAYLKTLLAGLKSKSIVIDVLTKQRYVNTSATTAGRSTAGGQDAGTGGRDPIRKATGGHILGPGTGTSDSIPAWLSNGEYVVRAAAVAKYGTGLLDHINAMRFADGGAVRYGSRAQVPVMASAGPSTVTETTNAPIHIGQVVGPTLADVEREARQRARFNSLTGGNR